MLLTIIVSVALGMCVGIGVFALVGHSGGTRSPKTVKPHRQMTAFARLRTDLWKLSSKDFESDLEFFQVILNMVGPQSSAQRITYLAREEGDSFIPRLEWQEDGTAHGDFLPFCADIETLFGTGRAFRLTSEGIHRTCLDEGDSGMQQLSTECIERVGENFARNGIVELHYFPVKVGKKLMGGILLQQCSSPESTRDVPKPVIHILDDVVTILSRTLEKGLFESVRLEMEEALRRSEVKYRMIFENLHDTYFRTDSEGRIILVSPSCLKIFGYSSDEMMGMNFTKDLFFSVQERDNFLKTIGLHGQVQEFEGQMRTKDGHLLWVSTNAHYFSSEGEDIGFEGILRDITERKSLEEQLIRAERMAAVGTLAGGVAHEFNNINLAVLGYSELGMFRKDLPEDVKNYFKTIRRSALRAKNITSNLLTFSGGKTGSIGSGNLSDVVTETLIMLDHEVASKGVHIVKNLRSVPHTMMDTTQIGQVILNILINAHHAMIESPDKTITVETGVDDAWVFVKIGDRGCGIPPEHLNQIFSPFFSTKGEHSHGADAQSSVKGTGLGLSISHTIVSNHKGSIDVVSKVGEGTTFTVKLPIVPTRARKDSVPSQVGVPGAVCATILILDDEPDLRQLLDTFLKTLGHEVLTTGDGQEALNIIGETHVDIVIVDLQMPKMTGTVFLDRLHAAPGSATPTVIVMTGKVMSKEREEYHRERVFRVIRKPFKLNEISLHVSDALLSRAGVASGEHDI